MERLMDHSINGTGTPPHMTKMILQHDEAHPNGSPGNMPNGHMQKVRSSSDIPSINVSVLNIFN